MQDHVARQTTQPLKNAGPTRRTVIQAAAWSVPVMSAAVAVPLAAASVVVDGLSIRFTRSRYQTTPDNASYSEVTAVVERTSGGNTAPVPGANITFTLSALPAGTTPPALPSGATTLTAGPQAVAAAAATNGQAPSAKLPNGLQIATLGTTDASGAYVVAPISTGPGWGWVKLSASTTVSGETATAETYIEITIKGPVFSFGAPNAGGLGNGNSGFQPLPTYVNHPEFDVVAISARVDYGAALLTSAGEIFSWGSGYQGANAQGGTDQSTLWTPAKIVTAYAGQTFTSLSRGSRYNQGAIDSNGGAYGWGWNTFGTLTGGSTAPIGVFTPKLIHDSLKSGVKKLVMNDWTGYALKDDGTVWSWGFNYEGSLGLASKAIGAYTTQPEQVVFPGNVKITDIAAGWAAAYVVDENGHLWGWGSGAGNRLGQGADLTWRTTPTRIGNDTDVYASVYSNSYTYAAGAVRTDGTGVYWGYNAFGQAGFSGATNTPTAVPLQGVAQLEIGTYGTYARLTNGDVYYSGWGGWGQGGSGEYTAEAKFRKAVNLDGPAKDIAATFTAGFVLV